MEKYYCKKKVTIGVAAYGNLEVTKKCIEAIKNSIDGNFEIILVDDFSPDDGLIKRLLFKFKRYI